MSSCTKSKIRAARVVVVCVMAMIVNVGTAPVALAGLYFN